MQVEEGRWRDLDFLLQRPSNMAGPDFEPCPELRQFLQQDCRVLCVGAGGLGCELLKDLALTGFGNIDVIDMDTIDVSNLNRQFLFRHAAPQRAQRDVHMHPHRPADVGRSKAEVAAARVMERVQGVTVTPHHARIEDMDLSFYEQFQVIILGLDSLEARRYMNSLVCSMLEFEDDGSPKLETVKPIIDGGTEGFKGHARVILPGFTACFECTLWLFPPQVKFPLCTLAETPRTPAHCIEYAKLIAWSNARPDEEFDPDDEEHMGWVYATASKRAETFGIQGVTLQLTQGVVKNIIPAIPSTNAIVAAACTLEALKAITMCSSGMNNYMMYVGSEGIYTHTVAYERDTQCPVCSAGVPLSVASDATLEAVLAAMMEDARLGPLLSAPSVSYGASNLYMRGVLEESTKANLGKPIGSLVEGDGSVLTVNDKKLAGPLRVRLRFADVMKE